MSPADRAYFEINASVAMSVFMTFVYGGEEFAIYHCPCANKYINIY